MAIVTLHPNYDSLSGRIGSLVFYSYNNKTYCRSHVIGLNPRSAKQQLNRNIFAQAVKSWQKLSTFEKNGWNRRSQGISASGYNYYLSRFMKYNKECQKFKIAKSKVNKYYYHRDTEAQRKTFNYSAIRAQKYISVLSFHSSPYSIKNEKFLLSKL